MTTKTETNKPISGHTPISNLHEENIAEADRKPISTPPSEGQNPAHGSTTKDGIETVKGYKRVEASLAELFTVPADMGLRDIGEASFGMPPPLIETQ